MADRKRRRKKQKTKLTEDQKREIRIAYVQNDVSLSDMFGSPVDDDLGIHYDEHRAITHSAVWLCLNLAGNGAASLPLHVEKRDKLGNYDADPSHAAYPLLHDQPSAESWLTSDIWRKAIVNWMQLFGNAVCWIGRDGLNRGGAPNEILPLLPDRTYLNILGEEEAGSGRRFKMVYTTYINGEMRKLRPENVLHFKSGVLLNPYWGCGIVHYAMQEIGMGLAVRRFNARFYAKGAKVGGILMAPGGMTDDELKEYEKKFNEAHEGLENSHRTLLLEDGARYQPTGVPARDAQLVESIEMSTQGVCNFFGVPGSYAGIKESVSYNSEEAARQALLDNGIAPHLRAIEAESEQKLLKTTEYRRKSYRIRFNRNAFIQQAFDKVSRSVIDLVNNGILDENEGRGKLGEPSIEGGDRRRIPQNITYIDLLPAEGEEVPAGQPTDQTDNQGDQTDNQDNQGTANVLPPGRMSDAAVANLDNAVARATKQLTTRMRASLRTPKKFEAFCNGREKAFEAFRGTIRDACAIAEEQVGWNPCADIADAVVGPPLAEMQKLLDPPYTFEEAADIMGAVIDSLDAGPVVFASDLAIRN